MRVGTGLTELALALLGVCALTSPAAALPVVYTLEAQLALFTGADDLQLHGATLMVVASADTETPPAETLSDLASVTARYDPAAITATFSNRPGGAPDVTLILDGSLRSSNAFPPSSTRDGFGLDGGTFPFEGTEIFIGGVSVFFRGQDFFTGTGVPPLPLFGPDDVGSVLAGVVEDTDRFPAYRLTNATFSAVPEPASAASLALGLAVIALARRSRTDAGRLGDPRSSDLRRP